MDLVYIILLVLQLLLQEFDLSESLIKLLLFFLVFPFDDLLVILRAMIDLFQPRLLLLEVALSVLQLDVLVVKLVLQHFYPLLQLINFLLLLVDHIFQQEVFLTLLAKFVFVFIERILKSLEFLSKGRVCLRRLLWHRLLLLELHFELGVSVQ